jgi:hypothetical protein
VVLQERRRAGVVQLLPEARVRLRRRTFRGHKHGVALGGGRAPLPAQAGTGLTPTPGALPRLGHGRLKNRLPGCLGEPTPLASGGGLAYGGLRGTVTVDALGCKLCVSLSRYRLRQVIDLEGPLRRAPELLHSAG